MSTSTRKTNYIILITLVLVCTLFLAVAATTYGSLSANAEGDLPDYSVSIKVTDGVSLVYDGSPKTVTPSFWQGEKSVVFNSYVIKYYDLKDTDAEGNAQEVQDIEGTNCAPVEIGSYRADIILSANINANTVNGKKNENDVVASFEFDVYAQNIYYEVTATDTGSNVINLLTDKISPATTFTNITVRVMTKGEELTRIIFASSTTQPNVVNGILKKKGVNGVFNQCSLSQISGVGEYCIEITVRDNSLSAYDLAQDEQVFFYFEINKKQITANIVDRNDASLTEFAYGTDLSDITNNAISEDDKSYRMRFYDNFGEAVTINQSMYNLVFLKLDDNGNFEHLDSAPTEPGDYACEAIFVTSVDSNMYETEADDYIDVYFTITPLLYDVVYTFDDEYGFNYDGTSKQVFYQFVNASTGAPIERVNNNATKEVTYFRLLDDGRMVNTEDDSSSEGADIAPSAVGRYVVRIRVTSRVTNNVGIISGTTVEKTYQILNNIDVRYRVGENSYRCIDGYSTTYTGLPVTISPYFAAVKTVDMTLGTHYTLEYFDTDGNSNTTGFTDVGKYTVKLTYTAAAVTYMSADSRGGNCSANDTYYFDMEILPKDVTIDMNTFSYMENGALTATQVQLIRDDSSELPYLIYNGNEYSFVFDSSLELAEEFVTGNSDDAFNHYNVEYYRVIDNSFYLMDSLPKEPGIYSVEIVFTDHEYLKQFGFFYENGFYIDFEIKGLSLTATDENFLPKDDAQTSGNILSATNINKVYTGNVILPSFDFYLDSSIINLKQFVDYFVQYQVLLDGNFVAISSDAYYPIEPGEYKMIITLNTDLDGCAYGRGEVFEVRYTIGTVNLTTNILLINSDLVYDGNEKGVEAVFVDQYGHEVPFVAGVDYRVDYLQNNYTIQNTPVNVGDYVARVTMLRNNSAYGIQEGQVTNYPYSIGVLNIVVDLSIDYDDDAAETVYYKFYDESDPLADESPIVPGLLFLRERSGLLAFDSSYDYYVLNAGKYVLTSDAEPLSGATYFQDVSSIFVSDSDYALTYKERSDFGYEPLAANTYPVLPNEYQVICTNLNSQNIGYVNHTHNSETEVEVYYEISSLLVPDKSVSDSFSWIINNGDNLVTEYISGSTTNKKEKGVTSLRFSYLNVGVSISTATVDFDTFYDGSVLNSILYYNAYNGKKISNTPMTAKPTEPGEYLAELTISSTSVRQAVGLGLMGADDTQVVINCVYTIEDTKELEFTAIQPETFAFSDGESRAYSVSFYSEGLGVTTLVENDDYQLEYCTLGENSSEGTRSTDAPSAIGTYRVYLVFRKQIAEYGINSGYSELLATFSIFDMYQLVMYFESLSDGTQTHYDAAANASEIKADNGAVTSATSSYELYYTGNNIVLSPSFYRMTDNAARTQVMLLENDAFVVRYYLVTEVDGVEVETELIDSYPKTVGLYRIKVSFIRDNNQYWFLEENKSISTVSDINYTVAEVTIKKAQLNVTGSTIRNKVYDGNVSSTIRTIGSLSVIKDGNDLALGAIFSGDNLRINAANVSAVFDTPFVAYGIESDRQSIDKTVYFFTTVNEKQYSMRASDVYSDEEYALITENVLIGNNLECYELRYFVDSKAMITQAELTVSAVTPEARPYDPFFEGREELEYSITDEALTTIMNYYKARAEYSILQLLSDIAFSTFIEYTGEVYRFNSTDLGSTVGEVTDYLIENSSITDDILEAVVASDISEDKKLECEEIIAAVIFVRTYQDTFLGASKEDFVSELMVGELTREEGQTAGRYGILRNTLDFNDVLKEAFSLRYVSGVYQISKVEITITIDDNQSKIYDGISFENIYFMDKNGGWYFNEVERPQANDSRNIILSASMEGSLASGHYFKGSLSLTALGSIAAGSVGDYVISANTLEITDGFTTLSGDSGGYYTLRVVVNTNYSINKREITVTGRIQDADTVKLTYFDLNNGLDFTYTLGDGEGLVDGHRIVMDYVAEKIGGSTDSAIAYNYRVVPRNGVRVYNANNSSMMSNYNVQYVSTTFAIYYVRAGIRISDNNTFSKIYGEDDPTTFIVDLNTTMTNQSSMELIQTSDYPQLSLSGTLTRESGEDVGSYGFITNELTISYGGADVSDYFILSTEGQSTKRFTISKKNLTISVNNASYTYGDIIKPTFSLTQIASWDTETEIFAALSVNVDNYTEGDNVVTPVVDSTKPIMRNYDCSLESGVISVYYPQNHLTYESMTDAEFVSSYKLSLLKEKAILYNAFYLVNAYDICTGLDGVQPTTKVEAQFKMPEGAFGLGVALLSLDNDLNLVELKEGVDYTVNNGVITYASDEFYWILIAYKVPWWLMLTVVLVVLAIITLIIVLIVVKTRKKQGKVSVIDDDFDEDEDESNGATPRLSAADIVPQAEPNNAETVAIDDKKKKENTKKEKTKKTKGKKNENASAAFVPTKAAPNAAPTKSVTKAPVKGIDLSNGIDLGTTEDVSLDLGQNAPKNIESEDVPVVDFEIKTATTSRFSDDDE